MSRFDGAATARDAARGLLEASALGFTGAETPPGCLLASAAISCSAAATDVAAALAEIRRGIGARLAARIVHDGAPAPDAAARAAHVMAVIQGMSTLARDGASRQALLAVVEVAMRAWG